MTDFSRHGEWLSLIDVSGPFLAEPVLKQAFPQGLEQVDPVARKHVRQAYDEWREAIDADDPDSAPVHDAWIELVLKRVLELDENGEEDVLKPKGALPESIAVSIPEHEVTLCPDYAVVNGQDDGLPLMFVTVYPPDTDLSARVKGDSWAASPVERMVELCRARDVRLGLVTDGERWTLVDAPIGGVTSNASWYARLWGQEPITLQAFVNLLGIRRFFVDDSERLPSLLDESLKLQEEVTDALGEQVRRAVEVLVQRLDRADLDLNRELLVGVEPTEIYEAALTVMMRIVFLLSAEERGLLLLDDEAYQTNYAVSTLRMQLRAESEEILEKRQDAWSRLLAIFRAVYGGIEHEALKLPALGGSLFDPDRFPFLEGRTKGTTWKDHPAAPLPIDNRTVLLLLDAVQLIEGRTLSYRGLDIEQIGYVYEGLLERTVVRAREATLDLYATKSAKKPWVTLDELEFAAIAGESTVQALLEDRTGSSSSRVKNDLAKSVDETAADRLLAACHGSQTLRDRIRPYLHFLRMDRWGYPLVYPDGTFMVTAGVNRRETGTHYTPKSLTETIVKETLEPLVYIGPADGVPREDWRLRPSREILDLKICDPAMGSGAFLVQVCRWLSERLVEAWDEVERAGQVITSEGAVVDEIGELEPLRDDSEDRMLIARRLIAERCLYGIDMNPLAVELAKLSIWLITLAKGRPFGFLDHNLRCGDSLLGIHDLDQLLYLDMAPDKGSSKKLFAAKIDAAVERALELRGKLRSSPTRDICDVELMKQLDEMAKHELTIPEIIADALVIEFLLSSGKTVDTTTMSIEIGAALSGNALMVSKLEQRGSEGTTSELPANQELRRPFHWPIEFPEVFGGKDCGFDAIVGNPPFMGNKFWKDRLGFHFQNQAKMILGASPGKIDLCVVFHRRAADLLTRNGTYGLLASDNIAEGSAIEVGLGKLVETGDIYFSKKGVPWPGAAAVSVSIICYCNGRFAASKSANGVQCDLIGSRLEPVSENEWQPKKLDDALFSFAGVDNSKGLAFVITPESEWFERLKREPGSLLVPYVTGDDITSHALSHVERWALDIADRELAEIEYDFPNAYNFLMNVVRPTRTEAALKSYKGLIDRWWQFWNHRAHQMRRLRTRGDFIGYSKVTKYPICMLAPANWIYTNQVVLICIDRGDELAVCLSTFFRTWLEKYSGGRLEGRLRLSISESIAKFPLPESLVDTSGVQSAREFNDRAVAWCTRNDAGMTDVMNAIHDPDNNDAEVASLRATMQDIDAAVVTAYGWTDVDMSSLFQEQDSLASRDRWRFQVSAEARADIAGRLVDLNRQRCEPSADLQFAGILS